MRWSGLAWLAEVRTHSARRRRTRWEKARDAWSALALLLALPTAWLLGRIVVSTETYALLEGVVFRPPSRTAGLPLELDLETAPEWGVAEDGSRRTVAIAGFVGPDAKVPTAKGTVLGSFLVERDVVAGGFPFPFRIVERDPAILLYDHASGAVEPLRAEAIRGHRHLEVIAAAIEDSLANRDRAERATGARRDVAREDAETTSTASLAGGRRTLESGSVAREHAEAALAAIRSESWSGARSRFAGPETARVEAVPLLANGLVLALGLFVLGLAAISTAQFGAFLGRGVLATRRERRRRSNLCPRCGHDVRANVLSARCPECGELLY